MSKIRKSNIILIIVTILIAGGIIGFRVITKTNSQSKPAGTNSFVTDLPEGGDPALDSGPELGSKIPVMENVIVNGKKRNLDIASAGKTKLIFFMPDPNGCHKCNNVVIDSIDFIMERISNKADVYLLYSKNAITGKDGNNAPNPFPNLITVENAGSYRRQFRALSPWLFYVDKDNAIRYYTRLDSTVGKDQWDAIGINAIHYAQTGQFPKTEKSITNYSLD